MFFDRKHFLLPLTADTSPGIVATPQGVGVRGPTTQWASGLQTRTHTLTQTQTQETHKYTLQDIKCLLSKGNSWNLL